MRLRLAFIFSLLASAALAQNGKPVLQSGNITPNSVPWWITSGVIGGGVTSADSPITSFGVTNNDGNGICVASQRITAAGRQLLCLGVKDNGPATLSLQNYGTDTAQTINMIINGTTYPFPFALSGVVGPGTTVVGNIPLWNNTVGTLLSDSGVNFNGIDNNSLATGAVISTATPIDTTFCGKVAALGNNAFFTFTVPSVSGFPVNCSIVVVNVDAWGSGRGKIISGINLPAGLAINGGTGNILWPTQSFSLKIINGAWRLVYAPTRVKPAGSITLNTDFTNGNDANDGLGTGAGNALKTVQQCQQILFAIFDGAAGLNSNTCLMASGSTDSTLVHSSPHGGFPGSFGTSGIIIDGGTTGTLSGGIQCYYACVIAVQNATITAASGDCVQAADGGHISFNGGITFGACSNATIDLLNNGNAAFNNNVSWSGSTPFFLIGQNSGLFQGNGVTVTLTNSVTVTDTVACNYGTVCNMNGMTWTLGGHTVTATHPYACAGNAVILGSASIPGSNSASVSSGCQAL